MKYISILLAILLFIAAANMPPGYYRFLRLAICVGGIFVLVTDYKKGMLFYQLLIVVLVIVFNPILPVYLYKKSIWMPIDIAGALVFLLNVLHKKRPTRERDSYS